MDYKKIIKSKKIRLKILNLLNFVPDKIMIKLQYRIKTGRKLSLKNPQRYTEKIQWYKLNYRNPLMPKVVDKYEVRDFVKSKGLENILNSIYGVYDNPEDIDFDKLPNSFVLKDTMGSGGNSVILVRNKTETDLLKIKEEMQKWVPQPINKKNAGREWVYDGKKHRIVAEEFLSCDKDLPDYKFFCFNGKPFCLYLMEDYRDSHQNGKLAFLSTDFKLLNVCREDFNPLTIQPLKPENYEKMLEYASILSKDFPHARIDFYNINGKIYFGEITFFNASGYFKFKPDEFDYTLGEQFILPKEKKKICKN